jgi:hypothetical protein
LEAEGVRAHPERRPPEQRLHVRVRGEEQRRESLHASRLGDVESGVLASGGVSLEHDPALDVGLRVAVRGDEGDDRESVRREVGGVPLRTGGCFVQPISRVNVARPRGRPDRAEARRELILDE